MTAGIQSAGLAVANSYTLSVVNQGGSVRGGGPAASTPTLITPTSYRGQSILSISASLNPVFTINIDGALSASFFTYLLVQATNDSWIRYFAADAGFLNPIPSVSQWTWIPPLIQAWTGASAIRGFSIY